MKIGIDISMLVYQGSGVATYTYNLVKNLLKYDKKNEYRLFYSSLRRPKNFYCLNDFKNLGASVYDYRFPPFFLQIVWNKYHFLPINYLIGEIDVFYSSDFLRPPLPKKTRGITTIHDLTWKIYPEYHTKKVINAHKIKLKKTIKYQDEIIVDSQNTKKDLLTLYPQIKKEKVHVIYPGIDERFKKIKDKKKIEKVLKKYLPFDFNVFSFDYLLYVGAIEPRKNLDTTIKVFSELIKDKNYSHFKFLIVGRAGWKNEKIFQLIKNLKLENKVIFVGYVQDEDLSYFYSQAKLTVYLSEYEGFGLPPVESAYCQTPVLLYQNSSLKEIFKENYPYTQRGKELITLKQLIQKPIIPKKYLRQKFTWPKSAKEFLKIINNLY